MNQTVDCDIVRTKEDLDHCVEAYITMYIVLNVCIDMQGQLRRVQCYWDVWSLGCLLECIP